MKLLRSFAFPLVLLLAIGPTAADPGPAREDAGRLLRGLVPAPAPSPAPYGTGYETRYGTGDGSSGGGGGTGGEGGGRGR